MLNYDTNLKIYLYGLYGSTDMVDGIVIGVVVGGAVRVVVMVVVVIVERAGHAHLENEFNLKLISTKNLCEKSWEVNELTERSE